LWITDNVGERRPFKDYAVYENLSRREALYLLNKKTTALLKEENLNSEVVIIEEIIEGE